ncbi:hypothetical protein ACTXGL_13810 [Psychrobacter sp. T6-6]|uniref:hypothetical protein n=1 Tax=Psychrobacter sp. T6-6 TaxID=3457452 RepID=UPI003FD46BF4
MNKTEKVENVQFAQAQQQLNRSEIATNTRAVEDLSKSLQRSRELLNEKLATTRDLDIVEINKQRKELFDLEDRVRGYSNELKSNSQISTAAVSEVERQQIRGLYMSGLYTQSQIASQYGITQSAVSQIVKMQ